MIVAKTRVLTAVILAGILAATAGLSSCRAGYSGKVETITFGSIAQELSALVFIAQDRAFFAANGLEVTIKDYDTGLASAEGLLKGEVDLAGATEFVMVGKAFQNAPVRSIATIDRFESVFAVGLAGRGIQTVADLKGKRIALTRQTIVEFYLGRSLNLHDLSLQDVTLVDTRPARYVDAIAGGEVDAVVVAKLNASRIQKEIARATFMLPVQSRQPAYWNVLSTDGWIAGHPELVNRFLKSLQEAEEYVVRHADEAKAIIQRRLNLDSAYMASLWSEHQFALSLDSSLIVAMNDEARWMINNNLTAEKTVPDFKDYIHPDGLKAVKPEAVNIIR
ncbi:MAG: NrtA/SsuA/CpmA family ABC transporter substrate-binding protein [Chloroflexi bacterium]|nr:NrtA/SsuA/CpmA family ABC transporter substrate-binding protein [Chloroflexota bacterium]